MLPSYDHKIEKVKDLSLKNYDSTHFKDSSFTSCDWKYKTFESCFFESCNLSLVELDFTKIQDVSFKNCKIVGAKFCSIHKFSHDFLFKGCLLIECNFSDLSLIKTSFIDCDLKECYFDKSILREADFTGSSLRGTLFSNSDLRKANFDEAKDYVIDPTINKISKAIFSFPHAIGLLQGLDVKIKEF